MLLNSIWLFALAALSIPVAIHLWNIRPGKTLKVGSTSLIHTSAQKSSRSFKLHDVLLLLLRCLLLALVAFILAMPVWQKYISSSSIKGWVMMPKENIKESYQKFKPEIDSLVKAGYEFHYFNKGFQKADLSQIMAEKIAKPIDTVDASYWSLVQDLDGQIPSSIPVYLFTPNKATYFYGKKPEVSLNLHWQTYVPIDSVSTWIAKAWLSNNNDVQVVQGTSKPSGTYYTNYTIRSGEQRNSSFVVNGNNGQLSISLKNSGQQVAVDTSTWRFAIYSGANNPDVAYVKAALESVIQFTKHKAVIKQYTDPDQIQGQQNWLFWLEQEPARDQYKDIADNFFAYETGNINAVNSWINDGSQNISPQKIALYKLIDNTNDTNQLIWRDGFGRAILSMQKADRYTRYHFYTRFNPAYNDLVWSDDFPKMLLRLIVNDPLTNNRYDRRTIDQKQLMPVLDKGNRNSTGKITERTDLTHYAWLLLVLVFVMERWMAHKKAQQAIRKHILQNG